MYNPPNTLEVYFSKSEVLSMLEMLLTDEGFSDQQIENMRDKMDELITSNGDQLFDVE